MPQTQPSCGFPSRSVAQRRPAPESSTFRELTVRQVRDGKTHPVEPLIEFIGVSRATSYRVLDHR